MESMRRATAFWLGLCVAAAAGFALRLHTRDQVAGSGQVRPFDSDSAYHLRRARFAAEHFPRTILFDPLMNFPEGGVPIWPPLYDVALAAPAAPGARRRGFPGRDRTRRGLGPDRPGGRRDRARGPARDGACAAADSRAASRPRFSSPSAPRTFSGSQYGHTDQHAAESFCGLLALVLFLASRERPEAPGNARREAAAGIALALAVLTWQGAIYWGAIFALALFVETILRGDERSARRCSGPWGFRPP